MDLIFIICQTFERVSSTFLLFVIASSNCSFIIPYEESTKFHAIVPDCLDSIRTDLIFMQSFFFSFHSSKRGRYPAEAADKLFQHAGAVQTHEVSTIYNIRVRSHLKEVEGRRIGSIDSEGGKLKNLARFIIVGANFSKLYIFP